MYKYKTTWAKGMNTRPQPNVNNTPNGSVAFGEEVEGVELWYAPANGVNVKKDDVWLRLKDPVEKWVAVIHNGTIYGEVRVVSEEPEEPAPTFPDYFDLADPQGNVQRYYKAEK